MDTPKFLLADNSNYPDSVFILHAEEPAFLLNLVNGDITWFDDSIPEILGTDDEAEIKTFVNSMIDRAEAFYDEEVKKLEELAD